MRDKPSIKEIENRFTDYKLTPQRRAVLEVFFENSDHHLSAEEVLQLAQEKNSDIGFATIYRALDLLEELEIIHKMNFGDGRSRYELTHTEKEHHHHHLVCLKCDAILEVKDDLLFKLEENIEREQEFKIYDHRLQFYGYCKDCQQKGE
ncbi:Fur family transcriptional regulator [Natranaerobius trueperi]|uniref:Transcriptional repressor n=1 Tax=Natranaerobius trueperi TaxID=759412 RepID=A0A226C1W2_9FIRM|nr:Fur family transcriptional regulator [Natranaerobius trueperi]OWZ84584.1 transcriptional repressor [Natranaerobius trueperi]